MICIGTNVVVDTDDWDSVYQALNDKCIQIDDLLLNFLAVLTDLVNNGFIQGIRHDNMSAISEVIESISHDFFQCENDAYNAIEKLKSDAETADQYTPIDC